KRRWLCRSGVIRRSGIARAGGRRHRGRVGGGSGPPRDRLAVTPGKAARRCRRWHLVVTVRGSESSVESRLSRGVLRCPCGGGPCGGAAVGGRPGRRAADGAGVDGAVVAVTVRVPGRRAPGPAGRAAAAGFGGRGSPAGGAVRIAVG